MLYKTLYIQHVPHYKTEWTKALRKGGQFMLPLCYSRYKPDDKSWIMKGSENAYDKWNISVIICDTDVP
jgi:hypothetical protein